MLLENINSKKKLVGGSQPPRVTATTTTGSVGLASQQQQANPPISNLSPSATVSSVNLLSKQQKSQAALFIITRYYVLYYIVQLPLFRFRLFFGDKQRPKQIFILLFFTKKNGLFFFRPWLCCDATGDLLTHTCTTHTTHICTVRKAEKTTRLLLLFFLLFFFTLCSKFPIQQRKRKRR